MKYYIAYGSNLYKSQMKHRCPGARVAGTATLKGWELLFKGSKTGSYLTIEQRIGREVPVAIWAITPSDELRLDSYEGYPAFYYKREFTLKMMREDGSVKEIRAFAYIMHEDRKVGVPSDYYMDVCEAGYEDFKFDRRILMDAFARSMALARAV